MPRVRGFDQLTEGASERSFYTELRVKHELVVPVVGSGLTVAAGAPSFPDLIAHLIAAAQAAGSQTQATTADNPFDVADALAAELGETWVRQTTAGRSQASPLEPTPTLRALSHVSSGVILTTNYDLAIEAAANAIGRPVRSLLLDEIDVVLQPPPHELLVVHLHGIADDPESIVLTSDSYTRMFGSEKAQLLLRSLGLSNTFVFLGHRLDEHEAHIRRDLKWVSDAASLTPMAPRHLLVTNRKTVSDAVSLTFQEELETNAGIRVVMFADPDDAHRASVRAAHAIAGSSLVPREAGEAHAPVVSQQEIDPFYLELPVADAEKVGTAGGQGAYIAQVWQHGEVLSSSLDQTEDRLIIEAGGGAGKSQELLQIALRSERPALLQTLRAFQVSPPWTNPGTRFASGMSSARAVVDGVPKLTLNRLRDESYVFLLDGLDEVPADDRAKVLQLLLDVAADFPQHRYVITSRPLPELREQTTFSRRTPMFDMGWVRKYAQNRGVQAADLEAALPDAGDVHDLIVIPIYAAAAVDRVFAGEALPHTAIELICSMADARSGEDSRIEADPSDLRIWLDRLALALQLSGTSELSVDQLISSQFHVDLRSIDPSPGLLAVLAARALLTDANGTVRFPANVVKESRAGRALLQAGVDGLALIRSQVLIQLPAAEIGGEPIRAVRSSWVNTVELLLPLAPSAWRDAVRPFDSMLVARSTPSRAEDDERAAAIGALWRTYGERQIWLERGSSGGNGSGDADAIVRLLRAGVPDGFADLILTALTDEERTVRGNAVELAPYIFSLPELLPLLTAGIADDDPVVRRRAAAGGWAAGQVHDLSDEPELVAAFVEESAKQAYVDLDRMAAGTLVAVAIDLASDDVALRIAHDAPPSLEARAVGDLVGRFERSRLLELLRETDPFQGALFRELVESRNFDARQSWTSDEVVALAHLMAENPEQTRFDSDADAILKVHPLAAFVATLAHPMNDDVFMSLQQLIAGMGDSEVASLLDLLAAADPEDFAALGLSLEIAVDAKQIEEARILLASTLSARRSPPDRRVRERSTDSAPASAPKRGFNDRDQELHKLFTDHEVATAVDPQTQQAPMTVVAQLNEGANRRADLDADESFQLFQFLIGWTGRELEAWFQAQWTDEVRERVHLSLGSLTDKQVLRVALFLPRPWPGGFGERVLDVADTAPDQWGSRLGVANAVVANGGKEVVQKWAARTASGWIDPLLVRLGDCGAEIRMIEELASAPERITRHPLVREEEWIAYVNCASSVAALKSLIKLAHVSSTESSDLGGLHRALDRAAGLDAPRIWEELALDADIPSARFLVYERRIAINALTETTQAPLKLDTPALQQLVVAAVRS